MRVVVRCRATLYERDGAFQLYVNDMFPDGIGAAQLALEQLKAKLEQEGLFAPEHKKPLPEFPKCIGVVTSKTGSCPAGHPQCAHTALAIGTAAAVSGDSAGV